MLFGVKGPSVLAMHLCFDLVSGVVIDDLHGIFLGVTLSLLHHWFDSAHRGRPYCKRNEVCYFNGSIVKDPHSPNKFLSSLEVSM